MSDADKNSKVSDGGVARFIRLWQVYFDKWMCCQADGTPDTDQVRAVLRDADRWCESDADLMLAFDEFSRSWQEDKPPEFFRFAAFIRKRWRRMHPAPQRAEGGGGRVDSERARGCIGRMLAKLRGRPSVTEVERAAQETRARELAQRLRKEAKT